MRELKRLLDVFEKRLVLIHISSCHHNFFFSGLVDGGNKVGIIDEESGAWLISDKWSSLADFIREKGKVQKIVCSDECLYTMLLTLVAVAYLYPDPNLQVQDKVKLEKLSVLAEEDPELKKILRPLL